MNFKLLLPAFLILSFSPAFGQLSDATGLVNRFDIETGGHVFEITTTANFDVSDVDFDKDEKQLTFYIVSSLENNLGEIIIPANLLSGNFTFLLNDQDNLTKAEGEISQDPIMKFIYAQLPDFDSQPEDYRNSIIQRVKDHLMSKEYSAETFEKYALQGTPSTIVVDRKGILRDVSFGQTGHLDSMIQKLIDEG